MTPTALIMLVLTGIGLIALSGLILAIAVWIIVEVTEMVAGIRIILKFGEKL